MTTTAAHFHAQALWASTGGMGGTVREGADLVVVGQSQAPSIYVLPRGHEYAGHPHSKLMFNGPWGLQDADVEVCAAVATRNLLAKGGPEQAAAALALNKAMLTETPQAVALLARDAAIRYGTQLGVLASLPPV